MLCNTEKFESHCGWSSFFDPSRSDAVIHLGHVFSGAGYPTPVDQRYCINSIALRMVPAR